MARGAPHLVLRILGPVVILSSLAVIGTGIGLIYWPESGSQPRCIHQRMRGRADSTHGTKTPETSTHPKLA